MDSKVVLVTGAASGIGQAADPLAGLIPASPGPRNLGMGLWVMHRLDIDTALIRTLDGFAVSQTVVRR